MEGNMERGRFITFEGGEGSGKTTVIERVKAALENDGYKVITTREPGGVEIAEQIRNVILNKENTKMDPRCEALLFAAARRQHLVEKVIPAISEGTIVLCDRFVDSSLVYQGLGRELGVDEVYALNMFAIEDYIPNLTLFFDIKPELGLLRIERDNNREVNRLDLENKKFHQDVYDGYKHILSKFPERIKSVDASKDVQSVSNEALNLIKDVL
jgi:dTMP kinase